MKYLCYVLLFFSVVACKDQARKLDEKKETSLIDLGSEDKQMIQEVKENLIIQYEKEKSMNNLREFEIDSSGIFYHLEHYSFKRLPYHVFDIDNYVKNPQQKNLMSYFKKQEDKRFYLTLENNDIKGALVAIYDPLIARWCQLEFAPQWGSRYCWLPAILDNLGTLDFEIFIVCGREYIFIKEDKNTPYYFCTGKPFSETDFKGTVLEEVERVRDYRMKSNLHEEPPFSISVTCELSKE